MSWVVDRRSAPVRYVDASMIRSTLRPMARWARQRSERADRAITMAGARRTLARDPVLIFSMGKTGTTALADAIRSSTGRPVLKAHALSAVGVASRMQKDQRLELEDRPRFLWACTAIGDHLRSNPEHGWDVISGVRDPIALAASDHFYGLQIQAELGVQPERATTDMAAHAASVAAVLDERFLALDWFEHELRPVLGVDVYDVEFAHADGYTIIEQAGHRVLVSRAEDLPRVGATAMSRFFGLDQPPLLGRRNTGTGSDDDSLYARFLDRPALPTALVDAVYATPLARHFYTDTEREAFARRWTRS